MSLEMAAILGFILERQSTTPVLADLEVIPDGHVIAWPPLVSTKPSEPCSRSGFKLGWGDVERDGLRVVRNRWIVTGFSDGIAASRVSFHPTPAPHHRTSSGRGSPA
jgi:hypothetical protein